MEADSSPKVTDENLPASFPERPKLSSNDICYRIMPTMGSISYGYFSVYIMDNAWFRSVFDRNDFVIANCFWFNAHIGFGLYLFGSRHLRLAPVNRRIIYSVFGASLLNFGSVLFWGTCKSLVPHRLRAVFGVLSGFLLLYIGKEYVGYVDEKVRGSDAPQYVI
ncbi:uncharacterized protein LOC143291986 [Babylonia areolata]|uniref:uncharacterized protein LOC143291986 n=1 Tax=Babylonia areolata TaxID=304850 RepID=UPI003FD1F345